MVYYQRNLPHWLPEGKSFFVTWRLHGSLPMIFLKKLHEDSESEHGKKFLCFDSKFDGANFGPVWLKNPQMANIVVAAMYRVAQRGWCAVHAYVLMPNHVHLLVEPTTELRQITRAIKVVQRVHATRYSEGLACHFGSKNRTIIGCAIPHPSKRSGTILNKIQSLQV